MNDEQDIRGELERIAAGYPLGPNDAARLLDRGRRGKRRRRMLASGGAVAAVSAVALTASLLPNLSVADNRPSPAGTSSAKAVTAEFTPLPGVPRGDAALGQLSRAELFRRCELRGQPLHREYKQILSHYSALGETITMQLGIGGGESVCWVPGDSRPSAATVAAAKADPLPSDDAGRLRNCSVDAWHDMTRYRVVASGTLPGIATNLVAMSPSGRYVVYCTLSAGEGSRFFSRPNDLAYPVAAVRPITPHDKATAIFGGDVQTCLSIPGKSSGLPCIGAIYNSAGRLDPRIVRIRLNNSNGRTHEIKVNDGWYALLWGNGNDSPQPPDDRVTAYDADGNIVPVIESNWPGPLAPPIS